MLSPSLLFENEDPVGQRLAGTIDNILEEGFHSDAVVLIERLCLLAVSLFLR
jgi:hypothetical protein